MYDKERLLELFCANDIILTKGKQHPKGFKLKSGKYSDIYINLRSIIKYPHVFNFTSLCLRNMVNDVTEFTSIIGIPTMGAVLAPLVSSHKCIPMAVIRQHKKDHGVGNKIEGVLSDHIVLVDDVITSGKSITEVETEHIVPTIGTDYKMDIYVVVDRQEHKRNVNSLITLQDIKDFKGVK
jgi:uridine monophosphate synthetase